MSLKQVPIAFEDPYQKLRITEATPTAEELQGIVLRFKAPPSGVSQAMEETVVYAQIRGNEGVSMELEKNQTDKYAQGTSKDSWIVTQNSEVKKGGSIFIKAEMSSRGEILKFYEGTHQSEIGKFEVVDWTRSPMFPDRAVRPGDTWEYREILDLHLKSLVLKQQDPVPYVLHATSRLKGFALVGDRRCAVIETKAVQSKLEKLKILFKNMSFHIQATIQETTYFDYQTGQAVAKIAATQSEMISLDHQIQDRGQSQTIYYLVE